jgi:hypothetical protein
MYQVLKELHFQINKKRIKQMNSFLFNQFAGDKGVLGLAVINLT